MVGQQRGLDALQLLLRQLACRVTLVLQPIQLGLQVTHGSFFLDGQQADILIVLGSQSLEGGLLFSQQERAVLVMLAIELLALGLLGSNQTLPEST